MRRPITQNNAANPAFFLRFLFPYASARVREDKIVLHSEESAEMASPFASTNDGAIECCYIDTHLHGRRRPFMDHALREKSRRTAFGIAEPNTSPHLTGYDDTRRYLDEMHEVAPDTVWKASTYLMPDPKIREIERLFKDGLIAHVKSYPPHGSTHTAESAPHESMLDQNSPVGKLLSAMAEWGLPLKRHAEIAHWHGQAVDAYDRERLDLHEFEPRLIDLYPNLRRILAHLSSTHGVVHMDKYGDPRRYICELTPHHAFADRRILYEGGSIIVDHHCLPVIKDEEHLKKIQEMLKKKPKWLVAGSDAAGHLTTSKYQFLGFGGLYVYHCDLELYLQVLAELGVLDYADDFLYLNAKRFFGDLIPENLRTVKVVREEWQVEDRVAVRDPEGAIIGRVTPFGFHTDPEKRFKFMYRLAS